jgi:hypothetical protein
MTKYHLRRRLIIFAAAVALPLTAVSVSSGSPSAAASVTGAAAPGPGASATSAAVPRPAKAAVPADDASCVTPGAICAPGGEFSVTYTVTGTGDCSWTASIVWGDGKTDTVDYGSAGFTADHQYAKSGVYDVSVTGSGESTDPDTTCTFYPLNEEVEVPVDHFVINLKLWIPQQGVLDPADPTAEVPYAVWRGLVGLELEPDLSNPNPAVGPFEAGSTCQDPATFSSEAETTVGSFLDGDGYTGYNDGTSYRAAATVSFDWNLSTVSNIVSTPSAALSHRTIVEETHTTHGTVTRQCHEYHLGTAAVSATAQGPSGVSINMNGVVGFLTKLAKATGAYPSNTWKILVNPDGSLSISYAASDFPSTGVQVLINGQVEGTDIVNDASCYTAADTLGPFAVAEFITLFHTMTKGSLPVITPDGPPSNVDILSPGCLPGFLR